jgi:hypothetical protein
MTHGKKRRKGRAARKIEVKITPPSMSEFFDLTERVKIAEGFA